MKIRFFCFEKIIKSTYNYVKFDSFRRMKINRLTEKMSNYTMCYILKKRMRLQIIKGYQYHSEPQQITLSSKVSRNTYSRRYYLFCIV